MKLFLNQIRQTITTLTLAAVAATLTAAPASAQLSALKSAPKPAENGPAPGAQLPVAVSPMVGAWQGGVQGPQQRMMFQIMIFPDGAYKARIVHEATPSQNNNPSEPTITQYGGQWKVEGRELVLTNEADQSVERTEIELSDDNLVLKGVVPNGGDLAMQRVQPNAGPNGAYRSQINIRNGSANSRISEQRTWKLRGRKIVFETEEESTYIPFKVEGNALILDYSEDAGVVAILSKTPGQGQIRAVGGDYGY